MNYFADSFNVYDYVCIGSIKFYYIMKIDFPFFLGDLLQYIVDNRPMNDNQTRKWFRQIALAVQYLHTMDIVHRDIKCENILISKNFTVKLADFSFSKFIKRSKRLNCNTYCCSVPYAPPELLSLRPYDGKSSDVWSLGVVLYIMIYKKMPFNKHDIKRMYKQQVSMHKLLFAVVFFFFLTVLCYYLR